MGLDMYLQAEQYIGGWNHGSDESKRTYNTILDTAGLAPLRCEDSPSLTVSVICAYWRKANHIHAWFVENVQGGVDECQRSYVTREQLEELRDACQAVIEGTKVQPGLVHNGYVMTAEGWSPILENGGMVVDSSVAEEHLPTRPGFFFGGTDYDEYYVRDTQDTIEQINRVLEHAPEDVSFYYEASW